MLGTGHSHFGGKLKAMMDSPDYEIVGIVENAPGQRSVCKKSHALASVRWMSEEELLKDPSINLVVVECSAWEALPWGRKVIDAGKHLHLEKPPGNEWGPFKDLMSRSKTQEPAGSDGISLALARRGDGGRSMRLRKAGSAKCSWSAER